MEVFATFLESIDLQEHRIKVEEVLSWIMNRYSNLSPKIGWNQPMFTDHGTFIIALSVAKKHMAIAPERFTIERFSKEIIEAGYDHTQELIRMPWNKPVKFSLLERIIEFNMKDKVDCLSFWRKYK